MQRYKKSRKVQKFSGLKGHKIIDKTLNAIVKGCKIKRGSRISNENRNKWLIYQVGKLLKSLPLKLQVQIS